MITQQKIDREILVSRMIPPDRRLAAVTRIETESQDFNPRAYSLAETDELPRYAFFHYFYCHEPFIADRSLQFSNDRRTMNNKMRLSLHSLIRQLLPGYLAIDINRCGRGITLVELKEKVELVDVLIAFRVLRQVNVQDLRYPQWDL